MNKLICECGHDHESHDWYYRSCLFPDCRCQGFKEGTYLSPPFIVSLIKGLFGGSAIGVIIAVGLIAIAVVATLTLTGNWPSEVDPQYQAPRPAITLTEWPMKSAIQN